MTEHQDLGSVWPAVRLIVLLVAGIIIGSVIVALAMDRDTGLGADELIALAAGAALGLLVEFALFRRRR